MTRTYDQSMKLTIMNQSKKLHNHNHNTHTCTWRGRSDLNPIAKTGYHPAMKNSLQLWSIQLLLQMFHRDTSSFTRFRTSFSIHNKIKRTNINLLLELVKLATRPDPKGGSRGLQPTPLEKWQQFYCRYLLAIRLVV